MRIVQTHSISRPPLPSPLSLSTLPTSAFSLSLSVPHSLSPFTMRCHTVHTHTTQCLSPVRVLRRPTCADISTGVRVGCMETCKQTNRGSMHSPPTQRYIRVCSSTTALDSVRVSTKDALYYHMHGRE